MSAQWNARRSLEGEMSATAATYVRRAGGVKGNVPGTCYPLPPSRRTRDRASIGGSKMTDPATRIGPLRNRIGEELRIQGRLYNRRSSRTLQFLLVRHGRGTVQC